MARKAKRQTDHRADIGDELSRLEELSRASQEVVELLLADIRSGKATVRRQALTRWGPACEVYKGVLKDRIRYKLSAKDAPIDAMRVESDSGLSPEERAAVTAAMETLAAQVDAEPTDAEE